MIKAAEGLHQSVQCILACMTKRRMSKIMCQGDCLGQLTVQAQGPRNRARHLRDFDRMRQARSEIIALMFNKNLCFVFQASKCARMNNSVSIALKTSAMCTFFFRHEAPARLCRVAKI